MKSFFKKLAFVMAMAMVVSLAAPAAASAAEKEVVIVPQTGAAEKVEYIVFTEGGEAQDFRFLNAPANWREIYDWKVVDPTVATVDKGGVVTPVAKGETKLQFLLDGEVAAEAKILVNPVSTTNEFDLTQASATQLKLTFTEESKLSADDFVLKLLIECNGVKEEVKWPATFTQDKTDKHVWTCTPSVKIGNGDEYIVYAGEGSAQYSDTVVTKLDKVDTLKINTLKTSVVQDADAVKVVTSQFFAGDVDLTSLYAGKYEVKYDVKVADPEKFSEDDFDAITNKNDWSLSVEIYEEGCALMITATLYDEDEKQIGQPVNTGVTCVAEQEWDFDLKVVDWALVQEGAACVDWDKESIPADKSGKPDEKPYHIVLKFKDNDGKFWVTRPEAKQDDKGETNGNYGDAENKYIDGDDPITGAGYIFTFYSTDSDLMLVDEKSGAIGVFTPADVSFYVKATYNAEKEENDFEKYIFAQEIEILEATKLKEISADKSEVSIVIDALDADFESTATVTMSAKDQHGEVWNLTNYSATYTNKDGKPEKITTGINGNKITFSANQFDGKVDTSSVKVTIVGESAAPFATQKDETVVTVKLVAPKYDKNDNIKVDEEVRNHYKTYDSVLVEDGSINIEVNAKSTSNVVTGYITLYKTSGDLKVGYHKSTDENAFVAVADPKCDPAKTYTAEGSRYVVMKAPDGTIIPLTWTGNKLMYTLNTTDATKLDAQSNELLVYAKEGNYTVEAVTVRYHDNIKTRTGNIVETATVKVENKAKEITVKKVVSTGFSGDCVTLEDIAHEVLEFNLNGYDAVTVDMIDHVEAVVIGDSVILQYVVLNVPVGNGAYVQMPVAPSKPVSLKYDPTK